MTIVKEFKGKFRNLSPNYRSLFYFFIPVSLIFIIAMLILFAYFGDFMRGIAFSIPGIILLIFVIRYLFKLPKVKIFDGYIEYEDKLDNQPVSVIPFDKIEKIIIVEDNKWGNFIAIKRSDTKSELIGSGFSMNEFNEIINIILLHSKLSTSDLEKMDYWSMADIFSDWDKAFKE